MPESHDRLSYKFQRLREAIRESIESGDLRQKLPGERELARRFGVNAKTISKALTDLTLEGLLVRRVGRGTFVASQQNQDRMIGSNRRYLWLASADADRAYVESMFELARNRLGTLNHCIDLQVFQPNQRGELPERCVEVAKLKQLAGIVLSSCAPSRAFVADLCRRHMPAVLCNARSPFIKIPAVVADVALGTFELTEHLIQMGHRAIRLLIDQRASWHSSPAQRGYHTALGRYGIEPLAARCCGRGDVSAVISGEPDSSAVICVGGRLAAAVKRRLHTLGGFDPRQTSLAAVLEPGESQGQERGITAYEVEADEVLEWVMRSLFDQSPGEPPREVLVPGTFRDRGSTHSVPATQSSASDQPVVL